MVINGPVLSSDSVFSSLIEIKGGELTVDPWVDITWNAKVHLEADGSMIADDGSRPFRIVPHTNCIPVAQYFRDRTSGSMDDLQFSSNYYGGRMEFPRDAPHELIFGKQGKVTVVMWDAVIVTLPSELPPIDPTNQEVWLHVDQRIILKEILPWLTAAYERGYLLHFSTLESIENDEQVHLTKWDPVGSQQEGSTVAFDHCKHCDLHSGEPIRIVAKLEFFGPELLVFRGDTNDAFQTRNAIELNHSRVFL